MSTNHTPNYSLSQWQASDQVLRTDFNEDNAKIDAALAEAQDHAGMKLIREAVLEEEGKNLTLMLTEIDWSQYSAVCIVYQPVANSGAVMIDVNLQGIKVNRLAASQKAPDEGGECGMIWLFPFFQAGRNMTVVTLGMRDEKDTQRPTGMFSNLVHTYLSPSFSGSDRLMPGSRIQLWGAK